MPQLLAAGILLAAITGGAVWLATRPPLQQLATEDETDRLISRPPATLTSAVDRTHDAAVSELEEALRAGRTRLDTVTVRILEENLQIIDRAIADARRAVLADPRNHYLDQHLAETMRRKLQLLRKAVELTASAS